MDADTQEKFHLYRKRRNEIAHGKPTKHKLREVVQMNNQLRELATRIDDHMIQHFFVFEQFG